MGSFFGQTLEHDLHPMQSIALCIAITFNSSVIVVVHLPSSSISSIKIAFINQFEDISRTYLVAAPTANTRSGNRARSQIQGSIRFPPRVLPIIKIRHVCSPVRRLGSCLFQFWLALLSMIHTHQ